MNLTIAFNDVGEYLAIVNTLRMIAADGANPNQLPMMEDAVNVWFGQTRDGAQQERRLQALNSEIASKVGQFWDDPSLYQASAVRI